MMNPQYDALRLVLLLCAAGSCVAACTATAQTMPYVIGDVSERGRLTYPCPDTSMRTIPYSGPVPKEDMVVYVKPSLLYPFDPEHVCLGAPHLVHAGLLCAGLCALWAYLAHLACTTPHPALAALNGGN